MNVYQIESSKFIVKISEVSLQMHNEITQVKPIFSIRFTYTCITHYPYILMHSD